MIIRMGWRNLWRNPRRTIIILTAIVVGIISMVFLSAFARGMMEGIVRNSIDNLVGDIKIHHAEYRFDPAIENRLRDVQSILDEIKGLLPAETKVALRLRLEGMLSTSRENAGVEVVGIQQIHERGVSFIGKPSFNGEMLENDDKNGLIIGQALIDRMGLEIGKKVVLMISDITGESSSRAFRIRGTYRTALQDHEKRYVFVNLTTLQKMAGVQGDVSEISLVLADSTLYRSGEVTRLAGVLNESLQIKELEARSWEKMLPAIRAYVGLFDLFMVIWFVVVFIAMGFGIVNTVLMAVYERMREFGLQRALGMRSSGIIMLVLVEVFLLLLVGIIIANSVSFLLVQIFSSGIDLGIFAEGMQMYGIERIIYPVLTIKDVLMANGVAIVLGLAAGFYTALHAARFTPVETMRHL